MARGPFLQPQLITLTALGWLLGYLSDLSYHCDLCYFCDLLLPL